MPTQPRWITAAEVEGGVVPTGGTTDQVLAKNSNADFDLKWATGGGGGGGAFLSANTARVDPSGDDGTGTVGDLTKPFLTVQAAIDVIGEILPNIDIQILVIGVTYSIDTYVDGDDFTNVGGINETGNIFRATGTTPTVWAPNASTLRVQNACIDIGINRFILDITITGPMPVLLFKGPGNQGSIDTSDIGQAFTNLTITDDDNDSFLIFLKDCFWGGSITTDSELILMLDNAGTANAVILATFSGSELVVGSIYGTGNGIGSITADDTDIVVFGINANDQNSTIATANGSVTMSKCSQAPSSGDSYELKCFSINAPTGSATVNDSLIKDLTCFSAALVRSEVLGTITTSDPTQAVSNDQGPYAYFYDFDIVGGTQGTLYLNNAIGSQPGALPSGLVITRAILEVITPLDSASHLATVALSSGESAGDLQAATVVSGAPWSSAGLKNITALFKTTGSDNPVIVVAVQDLTAGKFTLHIEGYLDS